MEPNFFGMLIWICIGLALMFPVVALVFGICDGVKQCFQDISRWHAKQYYPSLYDAASSERLD